MKCYEIQNEIDVVKNDLSSSNVIASENEKTREPQTTAAGYFPSKTMVDQWTLFTWT